MMSRTSSKARAFKGAGRPARVPVIIQMETLECGAASLAMVLAYFGKWIPLEQVRRDCGVSRDGSNAKNILVAARSYGLKAQGYRFGTEGIKKSGTFPCIIHWNFNHFVVLDGFKGSKAYLNDPARGAVTVSMEEFDESFTGVCLIFEPGEDFVPSGKPKSVLSFAKKKLKGSGPAFALVIITTIITSLIGLIQPGFSNVFADRLLSGKNPDWFMPFMYGMTALALIQIITSAIQAVYSLKINGKMAIIGTTEYMWHVLRLPMEFFSQRLAGDIAGRREQNASIATSLISTFAPLSIQVVMMVFYLFVMLRYSPMLSLIGIVSILLNSAAAAYISSKRVNLTRVSSRDSARLASATVSGIEMIETIKASGAENGYFRKWAGLQAAVNSDEVSYARLNSRLGLIPSMVSMLADLLVFMGSVSLCMRGQWTVGMISAFSGFLSSFMSPARDLLTASQTLQETRTSMERIEDVMEYPDDTVFETEKIPEEEKLDKLTGQVELKHVTFGYSRLEPPLIENFSMKLTRGMSIALVGPSGCGKSTIASLIAGLYKPWSGEILFDGRSMSEISRNVFTASLSVVDQDITIFADTIANNIRMWDRTIDDQTMVHAAMDAQIHEDIMKREGGYHCMLSADGRDLSGGQRQRLEIARVLAQDPTIIILDEATSALDSKTEAEVVKAIRNRGITCIIVTHRLSTIRDCDEIIVLDKGAVAERGTHDQLFAKKGVYAALVSNE